jgi:hypothetical protein
VLVALRKPVQGTQTHDIRHQRNSMCIVGIRVDCVAACVGQSAWHPHPGHVHLARAAAKIGPERERERERQRQRDRETERE